MLIIPNLTMNLPKTRPGSAFVKTSATWCWLLTWTSLITLDWKYSWIKWWSMSMCLDRSWWTGFEARVIANLFSQNNITKGTSTSKWRSNFLNQTFSLVIEDKARYSASVDDLETVGCFLEHQERRLFPKNTQEPEVDLLVSTQLAQSASAKAMSLRELWAGKNKPCPGAYLRYCRRC